MFGHVRKAMRKIFTFKKFNICIHNRSCMKKIYLRRVQFYFLGHYWKTPNLAQLCLLVGSTWLDLAQQQKIEYYMWLGLRLDWSAVQKLYLNITKYNLNNHKGIAPIINKINGLMMAPKTNIVVTNLTLESQSLHYAIFAFFSS